MLADFGKKQIVKPVIQRGDSDVESQTDPVRGERKATANTENKEQPVTKINTISSWFTKIKKVKNFEIYLAVGLILVMVAIYLSTLGGGVPQQNNNNQGSWQHTHGDAFARQMESRLVSTLSGIRGAGRVQAMVTVVGSATIEIAYNIDERTVTQTGTGGNATTTTTIVKTPVIIHGRDGPQPLIIMEINPRILGVVVVASGAADVGVRMQLLRAVQTVIADNSVRIEIFAGN